MIEIISYTIILLEVMNLNIYIYIYIYSDISYIYITAGLVAKASDIQAVGYGFEPRQEH